MTVHRSRIRVLVTAAGLGGIVALVVLFGTLYRIAPGSVGVVLQFGEYVRASEPGLHFKLPIVEDVEKVGLPLGVPRDDMEAYILLNVAVAQSSDEARERFRRALDAVAARLTPDQVAEAQRRARAWPPTPEP